MKKRNLKSLKLKKNTISNALGGKATQNTIPYTIGCSDLCNGHSITCLTQGYTNCNSYVGCVTGLSFCDSNV